MENTKLSPAVVEFHAFTDNTNRYIIKEFVLVHNGFQCQLIFDPPYSFNSLNYKMQRTARWLTCRCHHVKWDEKGVPYDESLIKFLCKPFPVIYTKGLEKTKFLREFHTDVRDIAQYCVTAPSEPVVVNCMLTRHKHDLNSKCALRSALHYHDCLIKASTDLKSFSL